MKNWQFSEVQALRDISGDNFNRGQIRYKWGNHGSYYCWNPSKSFMKIRLSITDGAGTSLLADSGIAPNMFLCDNLWQRMCLRVNGVEVSEINDYVSQVASLQKRMFTKSLLDSSLLNEFSEPSILERGARLVPGGINLNLEYWISKFPDVLNTVAWTSQTTGIVTFTDGGVAFGNFVPTSLYKVGDIFSVSVGNIVRSGTITKIIDNLNMLVTGNQHAANLGATTITNSLMSVLRPTNKNYFSSLVQTSAREIECIYKIPLGFFNLDKMLPSGSYELILTPQPGTDFQRHCIESFVSKDVGAGNDFQVNIVNCLLYICNGEVEKPLNSMDLVYNSCRLQAQVLNTNSSIQKDFVVNPRSHALTLTFQDQAAGTDTSYSRTKFKIRNDVDLTLLRFYIRYAGVELPNPYPSMSFNTTVTQYLTQRYAESLLYAQRYYQRGGIETFGEWLERGPYYHFTYKPNGQDRVTISSQFSDFGGIPNPNMLLFDHWRVFCSLSVSNGIIESVKCL